MIICRRRWRNMLTGAPLILSPYFYLNRPPRPEDDFVHDLVNLLGVHWEGETDVEIVRPWPEEIDELADRHGIRGDFRIEGWEEDSVAYSYRLLDSRHIPDTPRPGFGLRFSPACFQQQVNLVREHFDDQRDSPMTADSETEAPPSN